MQDLYHQLYLQAPKDDDAHQVLQRCSEKAWLSSGTQADKKILKGFQGS